MSNETMMIESKICINKFAMRQTVPGAWTHVPENLLEEIKKKVIQHFIFGSGSSRPGFRDGVRLVRVQFNDKLFPLPIVNLTPDSALSSSLEARRDGECKYIKTIVKSEEDRVMTSVLDVVLYSREALEGDSSGPEWDYEIVSFNGLMPNGAEIPMEPTTMARNQLGLTGGTMTDYPSIVWANSVHFWAIHAWSC